MGMLHEFKEFAMKGNVVDMAVGIIIGGAFGKIVTSLVNDVVMPPIGLILGNVDFSGLVLTMKDPVGTVPPVTVKYGAFLNTVIDFLIVAFVIFIVIKQMNRLKRPAPPPEISSMDCPFCRMSIPLNATRCGHCTSEIGKQLKTEVT